MIGNVIRIALQRLFLGGFLPIILPCTLTTSGVQSHSQAVVIDIDPATQYQTITGWEATDYAGQADPAFSNFKDELFNQAINDLGINRVRVEIRSGVENDTDYYDLYRTGAIDYASWRAHRYATVNDNADATAPT